MKAKSLQETCKHYNIYTMHEKLAYIFNTGRLSDAALIITDGNNEMRINVHKFILALNSDFFQALFCDTTNSTKEFAINVTDRRIFYAFLKLLYFDTVQIDSLQDAIELYVLANVYTSTGALHFCREHLKKVVDVQNVAQIFALVTRYNDQELEEVCRKVGPENNEVVLAGGGSSDAADLELAAKMEKL